MATKHRGCQEKKLRNGAWFTLSKGDRPIGVGTVDMKQRGPEIRPVPPMQSSSTAGCVFDLVTSLSGRKSTPRSVCDTLKALGDELCTSPTFQLLCCM